MRKPGIRVYRIPELHPSERRAIRGLPLTSVARTLLDIAAIVSEGDLELAFATAEVKGLTTRRQVSELLGRHGGRPGAPNLRKLLAGGKPAFTRSRGERRMLALIRGAGLPEPETNVRFGPYEADFLWRTEGVIVEVDGCPFHSGRVAFERDHRRDAYLQARGYRVIRFTWSQLVDQPAEVISFTAAVLAGGGEARQPLAG